MKILVRLPNWLGDMVMSVAFINQLPVFFPGARISYIAKKGIHELLPVFPPSEHAFIFNKEEHKGLGGLVKFGREIKKQDGFDLFFSLPNSFSSALMGFATGAEKRIGYKNELRQLLLTNAYDIPIGQHRVEDYVKLLELYCGQQATNINVSLKQPVQKSDHLVVNINSEAQSRRLTTSKAIELLTLLGQQVSNKIYLIGAPKEKDFVEQVLSQVPSNHNMESVAGKTNLSGLTDIIGSAQLMLSTDSGPAHLSNALGTYTIVLFGAGNENHTAPYNKELRTVIRLGQLSCEPCQKNVCVRYATPQCLERLDSLMIVDQIKNHLRY